MICNVDPNRECTRIDTKENHESRESAFGSLWTSVGFDGHASLYASDKGPRSGKPRGVTETLNHLDGHAPLCPSYILRPLSPGPTPGMGNRRMGKASAQQTELEVLATAGGFRTAPSHQDACSAACPIDWPG